MEASNHSWASKANGKNPRPLSLAMRAGKLRRESSLSKAVTSPVATKKYSWYICTRLSVQTPERLNQRSLRSTKASVRRSEGTILRTFSHVACSRPSGTCTRYQRVLPRGVLLPRGSPMGRALVDIEAVPIG